MRLLTMLILVTLTGCTSLTRFSEQHEFLREANRAELRMDKATATQATGAALVTKGTADYLSAKKDREDALSKLAESLK